MPDEASPYGDQPRTSRRPLRTGKKSTTKLMDSRVSDLIERREASRRWLSDNYYPIFREVYRFYKCKTSGGWDASREGRSRDRYKRNRPEEDRTRTNICLPDTWIAGRKKSSRMASRPPNFNIRVGKVPKAVQLMRALQMGPDGQPLPPLTPSHVGNWLSAYLRMQWDRGGEQRIQRRHILQSQLFGISLKKHWWDRVVLSRKFRFASEILMKERGIVEEEAEDGSSILRIATQDEADAGQAHPLESFSPEQRAEIIADTGLEFSEQERYVKWEGPVSDFVFVGDWYPEPELETLHSAAWNTFEDFRDVEFLAYWAKQTFQDPETGEEKTVFDPKSCQDLIDMGSWDRIKSKEDNLKDDLRAVIYQTRPQYSLRLIPGKRFLVTEEHTFRDGLAWVRWVGNERILLGEIPYPFDLYGHYSCSALTPIPDLLYQIGDSSLGMMRVLQKLRNVTMSQLVDEVVNRLKRIVLKNRSADMPTEEQDLEFMKVFSVKNLNDFVFKDMPSVPAEATELLNTIMAAIQQTEPAINDGGVRNQGSPDPARVSATQQLLAKASLDSLSSDEMSQLDMSLGEEATIKLYMLQQAMRDKMEIPDEFWPQVATLKAGDSNQMGPRLTTMSPLDIQEEFECTAESMSTLALDDIDRRQTAQVIYQLASSDPRIWNKREAARLLVTTFRGQDADKLLNDPAKTPPPMPPLKLAINWKDLSSEEKAFFKQRAGMQPSEQDKLEMEIDKLQSLSEGADALENLNAPVGVEFGEEGE